MIQTFSYVQYSQAQIQWSWQYAVITFVGLLIFLGLWIGYRNNQIEDEKKKLEKANSIKAKKKRLQRLESLYPNKKQDQE